MMATILSTRSGAGPEVVYPESDGQPMSDDTRQFRWIVTIQGGLDALFADDTNVFVAGDLLWYPVEGDPTIRAAPDAMVVFGRPKGDRGSYMQWREDGIAPQVVFEVLSPGNRPTEITRKLGFYERYGVEECYIYDPDNGDLDGWHRVNGTWQAVSVMSGWVSPRLGVRFDLEGDDLVLYRPDGRRFASYLELEGQRKQAQNEADQARRETEQARRETEQARLEADQARQRAERLAARLRELGVEPEPEG
jgi:Uma2 family endonuclease